MTYFQAVANELQEAIDRVRELHNKKQSTDCMCDDLDCLGATKVWVECAECGCEYPCPTIQALDTDGSN